MEGEYPYRNHWINEAAAELLSYSSRVSVDLTPTPGCERVPMAVAMLLSEEAYDATDRDRRDQLERISYLMDLLPERFLRILDESIREEDLSVDPGEFADLVIETVTDPI